VTLALFILALKRAVPVISMAPRPETLNNDPKYYEILESTEIKIKRWTKNKYNRKTNRFVEGRGSEHTVCTFPNHESQNKYLLCTVHATDTRKDIS